ncbi:hypothetical protein DB346_12200 [Verrucomicrobia bacterium LW23]|nr:hypothetical protein DB346_12200 [Verrucomicrobia bacterium LW23]
MKVRSFKASCTATRVTREEAEKSGPVQAAGAPAFFSAIAAEGAEETADEEPQTGARGRRRVRCPYCGRVNICWVSRYRYYYYSCWYCGSVFCI